MSLGDIFFVATAAQLLFVVLLWGYVEALETRRSPEWREQRVVEWAKKDLPPVPKQIDWLQFEREVRRYLGYTGDPFRPLDLDYALYHHRHYTMWREQSLRQRRKSWL